MGGEFTRSIILSLRDRPATVRGRANSQVRRHRRTQNRRTADPPARLRWTDRTPRRLRSGAGRHNRINWADRRSPLSGQGMCTTRLDDDSLDVRPGKVTGKLVGNVW